VSTKGEACSYEQGGVFPGLTQAHTQHTPDRLAKRSAIRSVISNE